MTETDKAAPVKPDAALVAKVQELTETNKQLTLIAEEAVRDRDEALQAKQSAVSQLAGLEEAVSRNNDMVENLRAQRNFYKERWTGDHKLLVGHDVALADVAKAEEQFR